ncbi:hypothetical protein V1505DRAFT_402796 [Lipomyces doorenjongii]
MGVNSLVIDKYKCVGDNWRLRYKSLSLHDPLANLIEYYADVMEVNVWTKSSIVTSETYFDSEKKQWFVTIDRNSKRYTFTDIFTKEIVHSAYHKNGGIWHGKHALVVGACTSAHDIVLDFFSATTMLQRSPTYIMSVKHGVSTVNPYKEGDDTWTVGLLAEATPTLVACLWHKRFVRRIKELDKEPLDGHTMAGFSLYDS